MVIIAARNRRGRWTSRGQHIQNSMSRLAVGLVRLGAAVGLAKQTLAQIIPNSRSGV